MALYFKSPYSDYYSVLQGETSLVKEATELESKASSLLMIIESLQSQLDVSIWEELGYQELVNRVIPSLKERFSLFQKNVSTGLVAVCEEVTSSLFPFLEELKEKDEQLDSVNTTYHSLYVPSRSDTRNYSAYLTRKGELEEEIRLLKEGLAVLVSKIDAKVQEIKGYNSVLRDFDSVSSSSTSEVEGLSLTDEEEVIISSLEDLLIETGAESTDEATSSTVSLGKTILYNDVGGVEEGYSRKIQTSHGKMVTVFQQSWNESIPFSDSKWTIRDAGCGYNALASILSSKYADVTPEKLFVAMGRKFMYASSIKKYLENELNIPVGSREEVPRSNYPAYRQHLVTEVQKGNMVMATVNSRYDTKYTKNSHWVAIVDYDPLTDSFYVTDSADTKDENAAPIQVDAFLKHYSVNTNVIYIANTSGYTGR